MPHHYMTGWRVPSAKQHVFMAIPTYGDIKAGCVSSLSAVQHNLVKRKISGDVVILSGNCHVDDARNDLCAMFIQSEATHLMFIDADIMFSADSVGYLLSLEEDIAAGVYPFKNDDEDYPVLLEKPGQPKYDDRGLVRVKGVPGGFMCISRAVIEKLALKNKNKGVWPSKSDHKLPVVEIFHRSIEQGRSRRSGDYEFCSKAERAGFKIWVAPNLSFSHIGDKIWRGCLQNHWLRQSGHFDDIAKAQLLSFANGNEPNKKSLDAICKAFGNEPFANDSILLSVLWWEIKKLGTPAFLETGSGVSTAVAHAAGITTTSLESEEIWGAKTDRFIKHVFGQDAPGVTYAPIVQHDSGRWYDVEDTHRPDIILMDGPRREEAGMRARICDVLPSALKHCQTLIVDDVDDTDGRATLERLHKGFGFMFDIHEGPRRAFAVGYKGS